MKMGISPSFIKFESFISGNCQAPILLKRVTNYPIQYIIANSLKKMYIKAVRFSSSKSYFPARKFIFFLFTLSVWACELSTLKDTAASSEV